MSVRPFHVMNTILGAVILLYGLYWIATIYPMNMQGLYRMFVGPDNGNYTQINKQMVGFVLPGIVIPVLPISIVFLGGFMLALDRTQPKLAIPLWVMACGAFDIIGDQNLFNRLTSNGNVWPVFQLALMFGGWALAGFPRFAANKWLALLVAVAVLTWGTGDGRPFEIALFAYITMSTVPNLWGKT